MASSSRSHRALKNCNNTEEHNITEEVRQPEVPKVRQDQGEEDWLKLGLGLGCGTGTSCRNIAGHGSNPVLDPPSPSPAPSSQAPSYHQTELGLGLGLERGSVLGQKNNEELGDVVGIEPGDYRNNFLLGWSSDQYFNHYQYYHHNNDNGVVLWSSWQIESQDLPMPVPCDSHHYCARSPHESGLWFTLRSSTNRSGEALPQIPKAYIRVRDENMTVFVVKKYLVRKLGLSNEDEIDISCMGESLSHMQTLKQVRDTVWLPRLVDSINSTALSLGDSHDMSINHLMSLLYRKHCILN